MPTLFLFRYLHSPSLQLGGKFHSILWLSSRLLSLWKKKKHSTLFIIGAVEATMNYCHFSSIILAKIKMFGTLLARLGKKHSHITGESMTVEQILSKYQLFFGLTVSSTSRIFFFTDILTGNKVCANSIVYTRSRRMLTKFWYILWLEYSCTN